MFLLELRMDIEIQNAVKHGGRQTDSEASK